MVTGRMDYPQMICPMPFSTWWQSLRAYSLPMTMLPILCAFLYARAMGLSVQWALLPLMLTSGTFFHAGTNLLNDYYDYILGFDTDAASGSSGVIQQKLASPATILIHGRLYLAIGALLGLPLVILRGPSLLLLGALALCGAYFYSHPHGYKYKGVGEPAVFVLMGPLLFTAAMITASGTCPVSSAIPAGAFGSLITAVLLVNNIRDEQMDRSAGFITLPMKLGPTASRRLFIALLAAAQIAPLLLFFSNRFRWPALMTILSLPIALRLTKLLHSAPNPAVDLKTAPQQTAMLTLVYGILLTVGLALSA